MVRVENLSKYFAVKHSFFGQAVSWVKAVENVSFVINKGETLGLVGETGCGKSSLGRCVVGLYPPTSGNVFFNGEDIHKSLKGPHALDMRRKVQMIFQDPYASLNPRMTVGDIIGEPIDVHGLAGGGERTDRICYLLKKVGLNPEHAGRFPHEFSGGQRQRIGIARVLAVEPAFIVCDEPISALDVSIQAQVVNLLKELQEQLGLTYLFIAHDLAMVKHISSRVAVMYLGSVVEAASCEELYQNPRHPYTKALLSAIPIPDPKAEERRRRIVLEGDAPSPIDPPGCCKFHTRCSRRTSQCAREAPPGLSENGHYVACHLR